MPRVNSRTPKPVMATTLTSRYHCLGADMKFRKVTMPEKSKQMIKNIPIHLKSPAGICRLLTAHIHQHSKYLYASKNHSDPLFHNKPSTSTSTLTQRHSFPLAPVNSVYIASNRSHLKEKKVLFIQVMWITVATSKDVTSRTQHARITTVRHLPRSFHAGFPVP